MSLEFIEKRIRAEIEIKPMGDIRLFKFVHNILENEKDTVDVLIELGYPKWLANKLPSMIKREKLRYQKKLNSCQ